MPSFLVRTLGKANSGPIFEEEFTRHPSTPLHRRRETNPQRDVLITGTPNVIDQLQQEHMAELKQQLERLEAGSQIDV